MRGKPGVLLVNLGTPDAPTQEAVKHGIETDDLAYDMGTYTLTLPGRAIV